MPEVGKMKIWSELLGKLIGYVEWSVEDDGVACMEPREKSLGKNVFSLKVQSMAEGQYAGRLSGCLSKARAKANKLPCGNA